MKDKQRKQDIKWFTVETDSKNLNYTLKVKGQVKNIQRVLGLKSIRLKTKSSKSASMKISSREDSYKTEHTSSWQSEDR